MPSPARRDPLRQALALCVALVLASCVPVGSAPTPSPIATDPTTLAPTTASPTAAACAASTLTPAATEGPFFKSGSPERASLLEPGMSGTALRLTGRVVSRSCAPIAGARVDFWQADANGAYDNAGFRLRGHQFTDADGRYRLDTVVPGLYTGRTRHLHVKVQAPGGGILTTQLYFADEARNAGDAFFRPELALVVRQGSTEWTAQFDFVLDAP